LKVESEEEEMRRRELKKEEKGRLGERARGR